MSKLYKCSACGMEYADANLARKCEEWCVKTKSCNIDIIKHAVKRRKS